MATFLHAADLHLGAPFTNYPRRYQTALEDYQRDCLVYLVQEAIRRKVDAILFAGDFFDNPKPSRDLIDFVLKTLTPLEASDIPFILALGNHDAGLTPDYFSGSPLKILSTDNAEKIQFNDWTLVGVSYKQEWDMRRALDILPEKTFGLFVGLFHSGLGEDVYMPLRTGDIKALGYDYLALGHIHSFLDVGTPYKAFYSGPLSQFGSDRAGFLSVDLAKDKPEWVSSPPFPIKEHVIELEDIRRDLESTSTFKNDLMRFVLKGELDERDLLYLDYWKKNNKDLLFEDQTVAIKEFLETPLYARSQEILKNNPQLFIHNLELLGWTPNDALKYISLHQEDLLIELKVLFRGIYD